MKNAFDVLRLCAIAVGMAITISCNTVLVSLFPFVQGSALFAALGIAGLCMGVIVLCFTELASRFPGAIGIRAFTKAAFGNRFSLSITLFYVVMMMMIGGLEGYLCYLLLLQVLSPPIAVLVLLVLVLSILMVNLSGYELSLNLQIAITVAVVTLMLVLAVMAFAEPATGTHPAVAPTRIDGLLGAVPRALFLFVGIEWAVMHVSRHDAFRRTLPIALIISVATIALLYGTFGAALQKHFVAAELGSLALPHLELARVIASPAALWLATLVGLLAVLSSFNVGLSGAARILYSLAREREIPAWFAQLHGPRLSPRNAMLFISAGVMLMAPLMAAPVLNTSLSRLFSAHLVAVYALILLAWLKIRRQPDRRGVKQPLHPLIVWPTMLFLAVIGVGVIAEPEAKIARLILLGELAVIGAICTYLYRPTLIKA
ncbi:APC family permease [Jeongeupia naejangsanensis]|uniref:APC family permease n=1 Tax=Jeongeupia naejangsanensis TaxID=613195 RepID=A0ABS2BN59_9NEIS|nr:APC family permease [Jeongeupia naejangsanensis]MBM3117044.1 APC family permease [Jeongeupia naejangsanensis]